MENYGIKKKYLFFVGIIFICIIGCVLMLCRTPYRNLNAEEVAFIYVRTLVNEESEEIIIENKEKVLDIVEYVDRLYFISPLATQTNSSLAAKRIEIEFVGKSESIATYSVSNAGHIYVNEKRSLGTTFNGGKYEELEKILAE